MNRPKSELTNLELFNETFQEFTNPQTIGELVIRKLMYLFSMPRTRQEFYELIKDKNIDLLYRRSNEK